MRLPFGFFFFLRGGEEGIRWKCCARVHFVGIHQENRGFLQAGDAGGSEQRATSPHPPEFPSNPAFRCTVSRSRQSTSTGRPGTLEHPSSPNLPQADSSCPRKALRYSDHLGHGKSSSDAGSG